MFLANPCSTSTSAPAQHQPAYLPAHPLQPCRCRFVHSSRPPLCRRFRQPLVCHANPAGHQPHQHCTQRLACHSTRLRDWARGCVRCTAAAGGTGGSQPSSSPSKPPSTDPEQRILILGGTGRVGSSTAAALLTDVQHCQVTVAGRQRKSYDDAVKRLPILNQAAFAACDIDDVEALKRLIDSFDLVIHAAGPFQRKTTCTVLEACIATKTPYMDVCDDSAYAQRARTYSEAARAAGVPAITTAGIYPGTSNVMAAHMISIARREYDAGWKHLGYEAGRGVQPKRVLYSYFTAGSGGAGPTILDTSLLLAGLEVVVYVDGKEVRAPPVSNHRIVDFGKGIGRRSVYLYHLPEVQSTHECLSVPSVSARFGTDPEFWNWAMVAVARLSPKGFLEDRNKSRALSALANPWVRLVDPLVGERVAMKVEVELDDGTTAAGIFAHKKLSITVGVCIAAFARSMLAGGTQPGVWFPEQPEAMADRRRLLELSAEGTMRFELNRPPWALEDDPTQLGMGFYW